MPSSSDYDTLTGSCFRIKSMEWSGSVLRARFGDGFFDQALVGSSAGLHKFALFSGVLPDTQLNLPLITSKPWFTYIYEFFQSHTVDEVPFILSWNSKNWTVMFSETKIAMEQFRNGLYSTGIPIEQVRIRGFTSYASDGSISS